jgi:hypothetical protein
VPWLLASLQLQGLLLQRQLRLLCGVLLLVWVAVVALLVVAVVASSHCRLACQCPLLLLPLLQSQLHLQAHWQQELVSCLPPQLLLAMLLLAMLLLATLLLQLWVLSPG